MASYPTGYDHPTFLVRRDFSGLLVGGTGTGLAQLLRRKSRMRHFSLRVAVAGTAAGFVVNLVAGTATLASGTLGTNTAGVTTSFTNLQTVAGANMAALTTIACVVVGDATGRAYAAYEYEELPDAVSDDV